MCQILALNPEIIKKQISDKAHKYKSIKYLRDEQTISPAGQKRFGASKPPPEVPYGGGDDRKHSTYVETYTFC